MANFRMIKIQATAETAPMLLTDDQIDGALHELRQKLQHLNLAILSVEPKEAPQVKRPESPEGDPWSIRGQPKE